MMCGIIILLHKISIYFNIFFKALMYNHTLEPLLLLSKKFILGETAVFTA